MRLMPSKWDKWLTNLVLPSVFWILVLLLCWNEYKREENAEFNYYGDDDLSVNTKASRKNEENVSVNLLMDDADERYLFSPIVEEKSKREAELILFENLEYRN